MVMPVVGIAADACASNALQLADWILPVELDLNQPTFIELNKLVVWVDNILDCSVETSTTVGAGDLAKAHFFDIFVLNERRTALPADDDNAIMAKFKLSHTMIFAKTTSAATTIAYKDVSKSKDRDERLYEDRKTGQGLLIAQPRIYLMVREEIAQGDHDLAHVDTPIISFKMEFRLTDRVSRQEFFTEMIGKFS